MTKYIISLVVLAVFMIGCADDASKMEHKSNKMNHAKKNKMFQSVSDKEAKIVHDKKHGKGCSNCGMYLPMFYKTNHIASTKDGVRQYCSIHCLTEANEYNGSNAKDVKVVATDTLEIIDAKSATYVVGSSKRGTMSRVSKYAFADEKDAREFAKEYGGKVVAFFEAYEYAKKDFK